MTLPQPTSAQPTKAVIKGGRYQIILPGGTKPTSMQRTSNVAKILDDQTSLKAYANRMVAEGMAARPDLVALAAAHPGDRKELDSVCDQAQEAAKAQAKANYGTALHAFTHRHHLGLEVARGRWDYDFQAYVDAMERFGIITDTTMIERTIVHHKLKIAGTADRLRMWVPQLRGGVGAWVVGDVKTGRVDFGHLSFSIQLGIYGNADSVYDWDTGEHSPMPEDIDKEIAVLIHLPAGEARCDLYEVNIAEGWKAVKLAESVRLLRNKSKKFLTAIDALECPANVDLNAPLGSETNPEVIVEAPEPVQYFPESTPALEAADAAEDERTTLEAIVTRDRTEGIVAGIEQTAAQVKAAVESTGIDFAALKAKMDADRPTSKRDELRQRTIYLRDNHAGGGLVWPANVPTFKASEDQTPEQLVEIESAINKAEKSVGAQFAVLPYVEPTEAPATRLDRDAEAALAPTAASEPAKPTSEPTGARKDEPRATDFEGGDCGAERQADIKAELAKLKDQPELLAVVVTFSKEANDAGQSFSLQAKRTERRAAIIEALIELARATAGDMDVARAAVRQVTSLGGGAEVGTLKIHEAAQLLDVAQRLGEYGVEFSESGVCRLVSWPPPLSA